MKLELMENRIRNALHRRHLTEATELLRIFVNAVHGNSWHLHLYARSFASWADIPKRS